jgi:hypothetical protein
MRPFTFFLKQGGAYLLDETQDAALSPSLSLSSPPFSYLLDETQDAALSPSLSLSSPLFSYLLDETQDAARAGDAHHGLHVAPAG